MSGIRNGEGYRLQCEGHLWRAGLVAWIADEEKRRLREKEEKIKQQAKEEANPRAKKLKMATETDRDFEELKLKLWAALDLLKALAEIIYKGVLAINAEAEIAVDSEWIDDCSLLVSTPCPLERYPEPRRKGLPDKTLRFPDKLRAKVPPKEAAPAALKGRLVS